MNDVILTSKTNYGRKVPDFCGRLYTDDQPNGAAGTWVRRAEVDALLDEIAMLRRRLETRELNDLVQKHCSDETGEYCDRRRHNFVKLPGGTIATCTYCNRPEPPTQKADPQHGAKARDFVEYDSEGGVRIDLARYLRTPAGQAQLQALGGKKADDRLEYRRSLGLPNDGSESEPV